jgi:two-component sensor histidine kinase
MRTTFSTSRNGAAILCEDTSVPRYDVSLELLIKELQHRIRNLLSVVQCFVNNTQASTADDYRVALTERLATLSNAYGVIENARRDGVSVNALLEQTLEPHASFSRDRILLAGPDIVLEPRLVLSLHLIFHELATNACKHGALTSRSGIVEVLWDVVSGDCGQMLAVQWRERGGPEVKKPERKGFGLRLISRALPESKVDINFNATGVVCRLLIDVDSSVDRRGRGYS